MADVCGFGLRFRSEIAFPELPAPSPDVASPDVVVRLAEVPEHLDSPVARGTTFEGGTDEFLIRINRVGRFLLRRGTEVSVATAPGADEALVRDFFWNSAVPPLLRQRGLLVLHASGVVASRGGVLFCGDSGSGKSTVVAGLLSRGFDMLTDDIAAVCMHASGFTVAPGLPRVKLWRDAVEMLGLDPATLPVIRPGLARYCVDTRGRFAQAPTAIAAIVVLSVHNGTDVDVERLNGTAAFAALRYHTRGLRALEGLGMQAAYFPLIAGLAEHVPVFSVRRPDRPGGVSELMRRIADDIL